MPRRDQRQETAARCAGGQLTLLPVTAAPVVAQPGAVSWAEPPAEAPIRPPTIRDLPVDERPRERLKKYGACNLSNTELLSIVWRSGASGKGSARALDVAQQALAEFRTLTGLAQAGMTELTAIPGVGEVKAIELAAAFELGRRLLTTEATERPVIRSPREVVNLVHSEMALLEQEELWLLLLNSKNGVQRIHRLYRGTLNASSVRVAELFRAAIRENCASVIAVHNHSSGDPTPSPEDVRITAEAVKAGHCLDIEVLDHVIVGGGRDRYVSLKERGLGFA